MVNDNSEMHKSESKKYSRSALVVTAALFFFFGIYFGLNSQSEILRVSGVQNKETPKGVDADFSVFWRVWSLIDEKYIPPNPGEEEAVSEQERVWGAVKGMVRSLDDPGTIFLDPSELEFFEGEINGNFEGIGMEVGLKDDIITVVAPLKNTPAYKAGIKPGDKIFKIDDRETFEMSVDEAIRLIRGEKGTTVVLVLWREGLNEPLEVEVVRDVINIPTVETEWLGEVFVIRLYNFSSNSPDLFRGALREFLLTKDNKKTPKIILDLRGNPGGFLDASVEIASWFLPAGKVVVREDFGGRAKEVVYRSKGYDIFGENLKMAVLIDGGSASASEILAGALSEHKIATLIGSQSFGKGSVQELLKVSSETSLKVTVARWITPNGKSISLEGLEPDIEVEVTLEDVEDGTDAAMDKAIEILTLVDSL